MPFCEKSNSPCLHKPQKSCQHAIEKRTSAVRHAHRSISLTVLSLSKDGPEQSRRAALPSSLPCQIDRINFRGIFIGSSIFEGMEAIRSSLTNRVNRCDVLLMYGSLLGISGALHLNVFEQPAKNESFSNLLDHLLIHIS